MSKLTLLLIVTVSITLLPSQSAAQTVTVSGLVVDARTGQPLSGVLVRIEERPQFGDTDSAGRFRLDLAPGRYTLAISMIGYAFVRQPLDVTSTPDGREPLRIELFEGAGAFEEHVSVAGAARTEANDAPAAATLHGRDLQALRGVTLDDPLRALHSLPSAGANDDFYSEFAVRGLGFRNTGLSVDGVPAPYLMHSVHGVSDGGSISMLNADAVAAVSLLPGSYPQRLGRRIGAQVDVATRDGDRNDLRVRAGLSGTSATLLAEGPLANAKGSWLVSTRRSYLDLLLKRIDDGNNLAFGFSDAQAKLVFDVTPKHQLKALVIAGASRFDEQPDELGPNDEARVSGQSWLSGVTWRYLPSASFATTQRLYATGLTFNNVNADGDTLDRSRAADFGWRGDAMFAPKAGWLIEVGADAQRLTNRHAVRRSLNDAPVLSPVGDYRANGNAASAYAQLSFKPWSRFTLAPGVRADYWGATGASTYSPRASAELALTSTTRLSAAGGDYRQFADLEQIYGVRGGTTTLHPETARHFDLGVTQTLPFSSELHVNWFGRNERDILWTPGAEPRRLADGAVAAGRGDAKWLNALDGRARGVEVVVRRDAPGGLSGWAGYAFGRHRYTDRTTQESFAADEDQRHALSLFGRYALSNRTTVGAKFRYGSNYPRAGYIREQQPPPGTPGLFGGGAPLFFELSDSRNMLRLPAYARLDLRADRTFTMARRRVMLYVEVANALNRRNVRNVPYGVDRSGRVIGGTDSMMPVLPSAGFVIEF